MAACTTATLTRCCLPRLSIDDWQNAFVDDNLDDGTLWVCVLQYSP